MENTCKEESKLTIEDYKDIIEGLKMIYIT